MERRFRLNWVAIGAIGALFAGLAALGVVPKKWLEPSPVSVCLLDRAGKPVSDVVLLAPDGSDCKPDLRGIAQLPGRLVGEQISIRSGEWVEIGSFTVERPKEGVQKVYIRR